MILVLTTPRTGSTWFCNHVAEQYSYDNLDEYFGDPELDVDRQIQKLEYVKQNNNSVVKCFPWHIRNIRPLFKRANLIEKELIKLSSKIYILIRSDFNEQCKSYYLAHTTNIWSGEPQPVSEIELDLNFYDHCINHLRSGYNELANYYKTLNCELVEYEHLPFTTHKRYSRPIVWSEEPPRIDFDPRDLFYSK
jgi:LPS sulfotransferase NodH